jgi:hypothetical protein
MIAYEKWMRPTWDVIAIPSFFISEIMWDSVAYLFSDISKTSTPTRRVRRSVVRHKRRRSRSPSLFFGHLTWLVLATSVLVKTSAFQGPVHPFSIAKMQLESTYGHILRLDTAVELSLGTFLKYHEMEGKNF